MSSWKMKDFERLIDDNKSFEANAQSFVMNRQFEELARLGAKQGARYMQGDLEGGVENDELGFAPEFHIFKDGGIFVIAAPGCSQHVDKIRQTLFRNKPDAILQITPAWCSKTAAATGVRASKQSDRITISHGQVYTAANEKVAGWMVPVGTDGDLARAGF